MSLEVGENSQSSPPEASPPKPIAKPGRRGEGMTGSSWWNRKPSIRKTCSADRLIRKYDCKYFFLIIFSSTTPKINIKPENDGLVQMVFLFQLRILRSSVYSSSPTWIVFRDFGFGSNFTPNDGVWSQLDLMFATFQDFCLTVASPRASISEVYLGTFPVSTGSLASMSNLLFAYPKSGIMIQVQSLSNKKDTSQNSNSSSEAYVWYFWKRTID